MTSHRDNDAQRAPKSDPPRKAPSDPHSPPAAKQPPQKGKKPRRILDEKWCIRALSKLPGLVAMGLLTPGQSNAIRGVHQTILSTFRRGGGELQPGQVTEPLIRAVRQNPKLLNSLVPLLDEAQFDDLLKRVKEDPDGADGVQ